MPSPEEEKIIICGLEVGWHSADAARHAAHAITEIVNLVRQTTKNPDAKLAAYLDEVDRLASNIGNAADQIMQQVTEFRGGDDLSDSPANV